MLKALVMDFDGLMVDTEATSLQSWQELYRSHGQELPLDRWATLIGTWDAPWDPASHLEALIGRELTAEEHAERYAREQSLASQLRLLPGVLETLNAADSIGVRLAVASSSSRRWVEGHLARLGLLGRFACVCTRDDVTLTKPDPELFAAALGCLGVRAAEALAYEDSEHGLTSANAAGLACVVVPGHLTQAGDFTAAVAVLGSLADEEPEALWRRLGLL